ALLHGDADALAEIGGVEIGSAAELAASFARHAVDPEGEANAVAEDEIDGAVLQRLLGVVGSVEGRHSDIGEEFLEIGLVAGAPGDADLLAGQALRADVPEVTRLLGDEARRRRVIARGEVGLLERSEE